jgi:methylated-DNA-[protein]-cysteine S-methyltransferase
MRTVRYLLQTSPLGELVIGVSTDGLCLIDWNDPTAAIARLQRSFGDARRVSSVPAVSSQLEQYFAGELRSFALSLDLSLASPFGQRVLTALLGVPFGEVTTYGALAKQVRSFPRAVGGAVGRNPIPIVIPCHRVLGAAGSIGGFSGGLDRKYFLLELEGHSVPVRQADPVRRPVGEPV